jgi:hypothetical protein
MKQVTFLGTREERSAGYSLTSGFRGPIAKTMREATRAPVVICRVLVSGSRVPGRPRSAEAGMQSLLGICFAAVPILFPNFGPPRCDRKPVDSIAILHIVLGLAR